MSNQDLGLEEASEAIIEDVLFVAVGKNFRSCKRNVVWALQNSGGKQIRLLHVHQPSKLIPALGGKFPISQAGEKEVMAHREKERSEMSGLLDEYAQLCARAGVQAQRLYVEADSIEKGIVTLISQNKIGRLVMGAASKYSWNMKELKSEKAKYVRSQAPKFCHIWFVCDSRLIFTRKGLNPTNAESGSEQSNFLRLSSLLIEQGNQPDDVDKGNLRQSTSMPANQVCLDRASTSGTSLESEGSDDQFASFSRGVSGLSDPSSRSSSMVGRENELQEGKTIDELCDWLEQALVEAEKWRQEAFAESSKRTKSEKVTIDTFRRAAAAERLYVEECMRSREIEEELIKRKEELEMIKDQLQVARSSLGMEIEKSNLMVKELEDKIVSAENLSQKYEKERDDFRIERDNAMLELEELRNQFSGLNSTRTNVAEFSYSEIVSATDNFNLSMKIGEGGFGSIFRASLRHTEVAIKVLKEDSSQGPQEFQQEVNILSKLRHPNIVNLIGVCQEASALIYEHLPYGSLEDRLNCRDNTPPLTWRTRIQIAKEVCSVLMFLQSNEPENLIHGDLKPGNILLDAHLSCKLSDFGICRAIANKDTLMDAGTRFHLTIPKGTIAYMDPEFLMTGELTVKSDVYSYGIVLLQLLTGKQPSWIKRDVKMALDNETFEEILDPSAGDWPLDEAKQLAYLALRCSDVNRRNRPDLVTDIWKVIEPIWVFCRSPHQMGSGN